MCRTVDRISVNRLDVQDAWDNKSCTQSVRFATIACVLIGLFRSEPAQANPTAKDAIVHQRPESLTVAVGDLVVRIDGPKTCILGKSFRMERRSQIRSIGVESSILLRDGVLIESARVRTGTAVDLRVGAAMMYASRVPDSTGHFTDRACNISEGI